MVRVCIWEEEWHPVLTIEKVDESFKPHRGVSVPDRLYRKYEVAMQKMEKIQAELYPYFCKAEEERNRKCNL